MTVRELQLTSDDIRRQASRMYIRERVEQVRAEVRREAEREIRAAIDNINRQTDEGAQ